MNAMQIIGSSLSQKDPRRPCLVGSDSGGQDAQHGQQGVLTSMAFTDPKAAAEYASKIPTISRRVMSFRSSPTNGPRPMPRPPGWTQGLPPSQAQRNALQQVTSTWAQSDPQAAMAYVASLPGGSTRNQIISGMAFQLAGTDITSALDMVNKYTTGQMKNNALQNIASQWPRTIRSGDGLWGSHVGHR